MFARANQLGDLADVAKIVYRPLVHHLLQRDLAGLLVKRHALSRAGRQIAQKLHVGFALLLEVVEGVFGVGTTIEVQVKRRERISDSAPPPSGLERPSTLLDSIEKGKPARDRSKRPPLNTERP